MCVQTTHFYWGMRQIFEFFLCLKQSCETTKPTKNVIIENIRDRMILRLFSVIIVVVILALVLVALYNRCTE